MSADNDTGFLAPCRLQTTARSHIYHSVTSTLSTACSAPLPLPCSNSASVVSATLAFLVALVALIVSTMHAFTLEFAL